MSPPLIVASWTGSRPSPPATAYALAVAASAGRDRDGERSALLIDLCAERRPGAGLLATEAARGLREEVAKLCPEVGSVARGRLCVCAPAPPQPEQGSIAALERVVSAPIGTTIVAHVAPARFREAIMLGGRRSRLAVLAAGRSTPRSLLALAFAELREQGVQLKVRTAAPGRIGARRALAGFDPGGATAAWARRAVAVGTGLRPHPGRAGSERAVAAESGQVLPLLLGLVAVALVAALALVALGGATTAKGRAQRAVDLAALSAARSMRDDLPQLLAGPRRRPGSARPLLQRYEYLRRARAAAREAAARNGLPAAAVSVRFEDEATIAPLRVSVRARPRILIGGRPRGRTRVAAAAALDPPAGALEAPSRAAGDGYSGPLAYRQGEGMRPDVAAAFDRLAAAAARAGLDLVINSGYRSDAEQARLFAANPDPRMVAPPGRSLHRCGTELDLGPPAAYPWLAARAERFGFVRRYSWEPWHYGYVRGPDPCSAAGPRGGAASNGGDGRSGGRGGLPSFVPARYRAALARAAAAHGVSAALLAAQLLAESNFDPSAVSPAGARGIAQFMPATAAAYGLGDPFDPIASIDAQARLMAELIDRFGSPRLALAAYNAGPAPVAACGCVPPYPETQAYVARIIALLSGLDPGGVAPVALEVRLVE